MKSLSTLLILGTLTALVVGGLFAVSPVLAEAQIQDNLSGPAAAAAEAAIAAEQGIENVSEAQAATAPTTGLMPEVNTATEVQAVIAELPASDNVQSDTEVGEALSNTFAVSFDKEEAPVAQASASEVEGSSPESVVSSEQTVADLDSFIETVSNGKSGQITGIYSEGVMAFSVVGQGGNAAYVSEAANQVTRFGLAGQYGSQGFLAHNYLAGAAFFDLSAGQTITVVYGDGSTQDYRIQNIRGFQALQPDSTQSSFVDLDKGGKLSASQLFHQIYNSDNPLVLQTCISNEGVSTWGRIFIIAVPV